MLVQYNQRLEKLQIQSQAQLKEKIDQINKKAQREFQQEKTLLVTKQDDALAQAQARIKEEQAAREEQHEVLQRDMNKIKESWQAKLLNKKDEYKELETRLEIRI